MPQINEEFACQNRDYGFVQMHLLDVLLILFCIHKDMPFQVKFCAAQFGFESRKGFDG